jgi:hypothetical protein
MKISPMVDKFFHGDRQTDRQTEKQTGQEDMKKLIVTFAILRERLIRVIFYDFLMVSFCM